MVREIPIVPDFAPGFVKVGSRIPKFQYCRSLRQELDEKKINKDISLSCAE